VRCRTFFISDFGLLKSHRSQAGIFTFINSFRSTSGQAPPRGNPENEITSFQAAALASVKAAEDQEHGRFYLMLVGAFTMTAASIKPSGILLLLLPLFARVGPDWRERLWVIIGAAGVGMVFGPLAAWGALEPFITTMQRLMPRYASLGTRTVPEISEDMVVWLAPTVGLALAAVLNIYAPKPPRVRVHNWPHAIRPHSLARATQGLVLSCVPIGSWASLLGSMESCLVPSPARGCMPARHGHHASLAGAGGGAHTSKDV
jgi:hypothetical protein